MDGHQQSSEDTYRSGAIPDDVPTGSIRVRCPGCQNHVEVSAEHSLSDVSCAQCGSQFNLVGEEQQNAPATPSVAHFEMVQLLGSGTFGSVWEAIDTKLQRSVAIKIAKQSQVPLMAGFLREARAAAQLKHPNIVGVHEVGREGETVYIVADLIRGKPLAHWLKSRRLEFREAAQLTIKIASALQHAHEHGIIHRDLKPHNIIMDEQDQPHLTDFGLARRDAGEMSMTIDGQILGTPSYMSPEQARGQSHQADRRSDIYSLGVMLYQFITGELPFRGHLRMVLKQVAHDEPPSPRRFNASVPLDLETICLKCMEKESQKRYPSALELEQDLWRYLRSEPIQARPITRLARGWRWCKRNPTVSSLAAIIATLLLVVSVGATTASLVLNDALQKTTKAQAEVLAEQRRADLERSNRQQFQKVENAAGFALLKEQIRAERWGEAERQLQAAFARIQGGPELADSKPAWERLGRIVRFYEGNDETWNKWGEEDYAGVIAAAGEALNRMHALAEPQWWSFLPSMDLDADEQRRLESEVYRLLLLHSAVQTVVASVIMENESLPLDVRTAQATGFLRSANKPMERAQGWEMAQKNSVSNSISIASNIMESINRQLLHQLDSAEEALPTPQRTVRQSETDNYFLGLMFFVVHRRASNQNLLCPSPEPGQEERTADDPGERDPPQPVVEPPSLFSQMLQRELAQNEISMIGDPLATSAHLLRIAAGSERRYWPNFALGRTLFLQEKFSEAELAFGTCASLRPDYARSHEQRALMRALQANLIASPIHREKLCDLARKDSAQALTLAALANDPSTWWPKGDLHAVLDEPELALSAYAHALEWEDDVAQKVNRRNNVDCVIRLAESILPREQTSAALLADANAVMALAILSINNTPEARASASALIDGALESNSMHAHALTARGLMTLQVVGADPTTAMDAAGVKVCRQAIDDFSMALNSVPENHLAAKGRAQLLERIGDWPAALKAWTYLVTPVTGGSTEFSAVALTPSQRAAAQQGRGRVLRQLGRVVEAEQAVEESSSPLAD